MGELSASRVSGRVWTVGALVHAVATLIEHDVPACVVSGEISNLSRAASGHCYFTLKDPANSATLRCAMFRRAASLLDFSPVEGQRVEVRGRVAVYEPRGELQFIAEIMQSAGEGALYERFVRLRARLEAEGLFDASLKRPLPSYPRAIGVVTSLAGAALHDVATTLARRSPHVQVVIYPSVVQGIDAPAALCSAIALAAKRREVDILVVCRGGGSLEDLWAFNDERVVRAIRAAPMHVVSGVGHETDVTLADLAADLRAPTPTAAAELVAPATAAQQHRLQAFELALSRRTHVALETEMQRLDRLALRLARPAEMLARSAHRIELLAQRLAAAPARALAARRATLDARAARLGHSMAIARSRVAARVDAAAVRLQAVDPQQVLARGYALLVDADERPITSVSRLRVGASVTARLADGQADLETIGVRPADKVP